MIKRKTNVKGDEFIKVGRIIKTIANEAHIKSADIFIDRNHIRHIDRKHAKELRALGITAIEYVKLVVSNYSEIRQNQGNSILLVKVNRDINDDTVTIELVLNMKKERWEVRTAQPRSDLRGNKLLYSKKKTYPRRISLI